MESVGDSCSYDAAGDDDHNGDHDGDGDHVSDSDGNVVVMMIILNVDVIPHGTKDADNKEALDCRTCIVQKKSSLMIYIYIRNCIHRNLASGADMLCYRADEDKDFDVGNEIIFVHELYILT